MTWMDTHLPYREPVEMTDGYLVRCASPLRARFDVCHYTGAEVAWTRVERQYINYGVCGLYDAEDDYCPCASDSGYDEFNCHGKRTIICNVNPPGEHAWHVSINWGC